MRRPAVSGFIILLLVVPVVNWAVTYTSRDICAFKGSTVEMKCSYKHPYYVNIVDKFWFTKESNDLFVDLKTDPGYRDRVEYICDDRNCTLRIRDLRESDSAVYKFRFISDQSTGKYTGEPGVTLSVADLQVQVSRSWVHTSVNKAELKCHSSCGLPGSPRYIWYKNEHIVHSTTASSSHSSDFGATDRFSCAVEGHEDTRSPPLLVDDQWAVTYTSTEICAFKESTVEIHCTYRYPHYVNIVDKFWFMKENVNLKTDPGYRDRVEYICDDRDCTLRIKDLRESDSAVYKFRFISDELTGKYTGEPGVTLSVAEPRLRVHVGQYLNMTELTCHSQCWPSHHHSYEWYKNGEPLKGKRVYLYLRSINPADRYRCAVTGYQSFQSPSVYAPTFAYLSVSPSGEIRKDSTVALTCSTDANPEAKYTWYKEKQKLLSEEPQLVFRSIQSSDSGEYYCTAENELGRRTSGSISIDVKYAPQLSSVSVSPSGEIVEGSSVTLTCSTDANPAASYTWYKEKQKLLSGGAQLVFRSIQSSESGEYYCTAVNKLGRRTSESISVDVKYAPQLPSVSVSPSSEVLEGSSVTLTCSSDANPAANYTWYRENQTLSQGPKGIYRFTSISSEDRGTYYCKSENEHGQIISSLSLDVQYAPKPPSVSVSPSSEVLEGSSVNLTCSSDANPAANYTWYKENKHSPEASGQIFTIAAFRPEHSGNYYCEAQNRRGRLTSTSSLIVIKDLPGTRKSAIIGTTFAVFLAVICLVVFLLTRKKRSDKQPSTPTDAPVNREELEEQDDLQYASVRFSKSQREPVYYNIRPPAHRRPKEEESVEYATVTFNSAVAAPRTRGPETEEDPAALYSTVNRTPNCKRNL